MTYFEGFIVPVPEANKDAYRKHASDFAPMFQEIGVRRMVETWDSDVPEGKVTDFRKAVDAEAGREGRLLVVRISLEGRARRGEREVHERPAHGGNGREHAVRRQAHDHGRLRSDRRRRHRPAAAIPTASSCRCPKASATPIASSRPRWRRCSVEHGATRVVEAFGDDVPHGKVTDFYRAVKAEDGENVVFSFIEWPDKATRDDGLEGKIMADESLKPQGEMPFDGKRMFWGGFEKIVDTADSPRQRADHRLTRDCNSRQKEIEP